MKWYGVLMPVADRAGWIVGAGLVLAAAGVTPDMLKVYEAALDAYRTAAGLPVAGHAEHVEYEVGRGYEAIRELELQWLGKPVTEREQPGERPSRPMAQLSVADTPWEGEPLAPLKVLRGRGNKLIRIPADLPARTICEVRHHGHGTTAVHQRRWAFTPNWSEIAVTGDQVVRELFEPRSGYTFRYLRIVSGRPGRGQARPSEHQAVRGRTGDRPQDRPHGGRRRRRVVRAGGPDPAERPRGLVVVRRRRADVEPMSAEAPPLRSFSTSIKGSGYEPIRLAGPRSHFKVRNVGGYHFSVRLLGPDLAPEATLIDKGGYRARQDVNFELTLLLEEGSILQIDTDEGEWSLQRCEP